jgi:hypothetical protein
LQKQERAGSAPVAEGRLLSGIPVLARVLRQADTRSPYRLGRTIGGVLRGF